MTTKKLTLVPSAKPSPLVRLVDDYLMEARAKGLSPKSIKYATGWPLKEIFLPWCADNDIASVEQMDNRTCNQFSVHLAEHGGKTGKPLAQASIATYAKSVRRFLAWATEQGEKVPGTVKLPKMPARIVEVLTTSEVERLESAATSERDKLIIQLFAQTGLRRGELVGIATKDLLDEGGKTYLRIHGKGGKDRKVGLHPTMARRLRRYIGSRPKDAGTDRIFLALKHRPDGTLEPISESGITQMVSALGERAGINRPVFPHMIRHTAATMMLRRGMDSLLVAQVLGHSGLQMLQRHYSHTTASDAHAALMAVLVAED
jgi:integrase/recombinase XerD